MNKQKKYSIDIPRDIWRLITNLWTSLTIVFFVLDFFFQNRYSTSAGIISTVYIAILGIYATTKEFDRWTNRYADGRHFGEWSAVLWTIVLMFFIIFAMFSDAKHTVSQEMVTTYIIVLTVLIVTTKSKVLHRQQPK